MQNHLATVLTALALLDNPAQLAVAAPLADLRGGQTGRIEFNSSNPVNRWQMIRGRLGESQTVWGDLLMPKNAAGKVPAVVFSHGSEGVTAMYFEVWARALNDAGTAVFVVDSFKPRGLDNITGPVKQLSYDAQVSNVSDALHALKLLSTHPQIDANRIFHQGWSRGGSTVLAAAWPANQTVLPQGMKWAGSIAVYPGCNIRYRSEKPAMPSPMFMVLAAKDDMTPAAPCVEYAKDSIGSGNPVTYKVYEGAYHVFDRINHKFSYSREGTYRECDIDLRMPTKHEQSWGDGYDRLAKKPLLMPTDFSAAIKACEVVASVVSETNHKAREQAVSDVLEFIKKY